MSRVIRPTFLVNFGKIDFFEKKTVALSILYCKSPVTHFLYITVVPFANRERSRGERIVNIIFEPCIFAILAKNITSLCNTMQISFSDYGL